MVLCIQAYTIKRLINAKDSGYKYGLMVLSIRDNGIEIKQMGLADSSLLMGTATKEIGKMIKLMDMASIIMQTELCTKAIG
jgi:hypothetical protein